MGLACLLGECGQFGKFKFLNTESKMSKVKHIEQQKAYVEYASMVDNSKQSTLNKVETAAYISDVVLQLRNMAKSADLKFLVYFLEMAFQEAFSQSTQEKNKEPKKEKHG